MKAVISEIVIWQNIYIHMTEVAKRTKPRVPFSTYFRHDFSTNQTKCNEHTRMITLCSISDLF
jgi:hypothetical protein